MKLLAFDTSTTACSVAIFEDEKLLAVDCQPQPKQQAQLLLPMIDSILTLVGYEVAELDAIALTIGPGSFVGLRIGVGVAQGLAVVHDLPIVPISTLRVMAQTAYRQYGISHSLIALDAHKDEIYYAAYQINNHLADLVIGEMLIQPQQACLPIGTWSGIGDGWEKYAAQLKKIKPQQILPLLYPQAQDLGVLAHLAYQKQQTVSAMELHPIYLRNEDAWKPQV